MTYEEYEAGLRAWWKNAKETAERRLGVPLDKLIMAEGLELIPWRVLHSHYWERRISAEDFAEELVKEFSNTGKITEEEEEIIRGRSPRLLRENWGVGGH